MGAMDGSLLHRDRERERSTWLYRGHLLLAFLTIVDEILTKSVYNDINVFYKLLRTVPCISAFLLSKFGIKI